MGFESPLFLLGVVLALVPIGILWFWRTRAMRVPLDSVRWLVLRSAGVASRMRTRQILLMLVRALLLVLLAFLFARPYIRQTYVSKRGFEQPVAFALLIDDSMSMNYQCEGISAWDAAKSQWLSVLQELPDESDIFVITVSNPGHIIRSKYSLWAGDTLFPQVNELRAGQQAGQLGAAMRTAVQALRMAPNRQKRMLIVSDFFAHGMYGLLEHTELSGIHVDHIDVGNRCEYSNHAIVDVSTTLALDVSSSHVRVSVELANFSSDVLDEVLTLQIGNLKTAARVVCDPWKHCGHEFLVAVEDKSTSGMVRLPPDALPQDDVRWFSLAPRTKNAVLLVSGDPGWREDREESFFLSHALGVKTSDDAGFTVTTVRPDEFSPLHLSGVATVGLLNVTRLTPEQSQALLSFVSSGGGLLISMGDNVDRDIYNRTFAEFLPAPIRDEVRFDSDESPFPVISWASADWLEGLLSGEGGLFHVQVHRGILMEDFSHGEPRILATLDNGIPVLVEHHVGQGTVLMLTTSIDRDWTDLPLRPVFPPLMRALFSYLGEASRGLGHNALLTKEPWRVEIPDGKERVTVISPDKTATVFSSGGMYRDTFLPGTYQVFVQDDGGRQTTFVVNIDPEESVLYQDREFLQSWWMSLEGEFTELVESPPFRKIFLGGWLLGACLLLLGVESVLRGKI